MTLWGWDLSHYDGPDSRKAIDQGFSFFTHKAGGDGNDVELNDWWNLMKGYRASVLLGAYWVLYPGSPQARADQFLARLDSQCAGWRNGPFILQVDCEKWNGDAGTVPSLAEIRSFCDRLTDAMPKLRPIVYAPRWVYGDSLRGLEYPLWASAYVTSSGSAASIYPGDNSNKWGAYSGQTPAVLQFTSSAVIAGQTTCDANAFRGTLAELTKLLAPGWVQKEIDMDLTPQNLADIAKAVWNTDSLGVPGMPDDGKPENSWTGESFIRNTYVEAKNARIAAQALANAGSEPATIDVAALAGALAPLLPPTPVVDVETLSSALINAIRQLAAPAGE